LLDWLSMMLLGSNVHFNSNSSIVFILTLTNIMPTLSQCIGSYHEVLKSMHVSFSLHLFISSILFLFSLYNVFKIYWYCYIKKKLIYFKIRIYSNIESIFIFHVSFFSNSWSWLWGCVFSSQASQRGWQCHEREKTTHIRLLCMDSPTPK